MRILLILLIGIFLFAKEYSIQVFSAVDLKPVLRIYKELKHYPYARIEKIGKFYTLRVYKTNHVKPLKPYLKQLRKKYKSSFIRSVKWIEKRIVYPKKVKIKKEKLKNIFNLLPVTRNILIKKEALHSSNTIKIPPYALLSLDLLKNNKEEISSLIKKYDKKLPFRDKFEGLVRLKRISKAKELAFNNIKNSDEYLTYKQIRDFYMNYANRFKIQNDFVDSKPVSYFVNKNSIKHYFLRGYYIYIKDENYLTNQFSNVTLVRLGIKKLLNKGYNYFEIGSKNSKILFLFKNSYPSRKFESNFYIGRGNADESDYLLFNAIKTFLKEEFTFYVTNRNYIQTTVSFNNYNDKNNFLGNGMTVNLRYVRKLRVTYPDFSYYTFFNFNKFSSNSKLPQSSYECGIGYFFGLDHKDIYFHTIKPFFDTYLDYNFKYGTSLNFLLGAGGRLYRHDNLSAGIKYSKTLDGAKYFEYLLNYIFWF